jgi:hypothetical protein
MSQAEVKEVPWLPLEAALQFLTLKIIFDWEF